MVRPRSELVRKLTDNLECIAISFVMALVLKFFLLEIYKIPTGSMQPTIMGDPKIGMFDRVMVNKLIYFLRRPERFEIVVFKNPLQQNQNYIKRIAAFGGETLKIRNGDLFVRGPGESEDRVCRKPDRIWRSVRKRLEQDYVALETAARSIEERMTAEVHQFRERAVNASSTRDRERLSLQHEGRMRGLVREQGDAIARHLGAARQDRLWKQYRGTLEVAPEDLQQYPGSVTLTRDRFLLQAEGSSAAAAEFVQPIVDELFHGFDVSWMRAYVKAGGSLLHGKRRAVTDVEVALRMTPAARKCELVVLLQEGGRSHRLTLPAGGGSAVLTSFTRTPAGDAAIDRELLCAAAEIDAVDGSSRVALRNVDDELVFDLDGREVLRVPYDTVGLDREEATRLFLVAHGGEIAVADVTVWRDIHYLPGRMDQIEREGTWSVPDGAFLALGDSTQTSADSRLWEMATYRPEGGEPITGNWFSGQAHPDANPRLDGPTMQFRNLFGQPYDLPLSRLPEPQRRDGVPPPETVEPLHHVPEEFLLGKALAVFWPFPPFAPSWRIGWLR